MIDGPLLKVTAPSEYIRPSSAHKMAFQKPTKHSRTRALYVAIRGATLDTVLSCLQRTAGSMLLPPRSPPSLAKPLRNATSQKLPVGPGLAKAAVARRLPHRKTGLRSGHRCARRLSLCIPLHPIISLHPISHLR